MIKELAAKVFAGLVHRKNQKWIQNPINAQNQVFQELLKKGRNTVFGKDHAFETITEINQFKAKVPVRDYEAFRPYI